MDIDKTYASQFELAQQYINNQVESLDEGNEKRRAEFSRDVPSFENQLDTFVESVETKEEPRAESSTQNTGLTGALLYEANNRYQHIKPIPHTTGGVHFDVLESYNTTLSMETGEELAAFPSQRHIDITV